jgi:hypothetical protein
MASFNSGFWGFFKKIAMPLQVGLNFSKFKHTQPEFLAVTGALTIFAPHQKKLKICHPLQ